MSTHLEELIDQTPTCPGVYIMLDKNNAVLYIGKAKNIRSRLQGYKAGRDGRGFVQLLEKEVERIDVTVTQNEKEALILENTLIKAKKPRYNIKLKDDANYLCIKLTTSHTYPRIEAVRGMKRGDKNRYFGPFHSAQSLRKTVNLLNKYFGLRTCSDRVLKERKYPCMQHHMKRCPAPCVLKPEPPDAYTQNVERVIAFLEGRHKELKEELETQMHAAAFTLKRQPSFETKYSPSKSPWSLNPFYMQISQIETSLEAMSHLKWLFFQSLKFVTANV
jgi:excinuclease ABC subunit C